MPQRALQSAVFVATLLALACCSELHAQEWARKMFEDIDHDFGVVARGSDTVYKFEVKNIYKEDVVLESVRSSCGCTSPSIENHEIKTYEKAYIVAKFNTRTFTGPHSATLTVRISKPYPAQVQLRVHGNIRGDIVFEPGSIDFATVEQGARHEKTINVTYAGRSGWRVEDVRSASDYLEAELVERQRYSGRVSYDLLLRLKETAPPGYLKQQLVLVTNDSSNPRIPVDVSGKVEAELTVSPENLVLGDVEHGETVTKRFIVKGKKPFRVTGVSCGDDSFEFETDEDPAERHLVTVKFTADHDPGRLRKPITVSTDLGDTYRAICQAYANVVAPPSSSSATEVEPKDDESLAERTALSRN